MRLSLPVEAIGMANSWMFTSRNEQFPKVNYAWPVKSENHDRRAATSGDADEQRGIIAPDEMFAPAVVSGMIQWRDSAANGIYAGDEHMLQAVTTLASMREVGEFVCAAQRARRDVVYREWVRTVGGRTQAVFATPVGTGFDSVSRFLR